MMKNYLYIKTLQSVQRWWLVLGLRDELISRQLAKLILPVPISNSTTFLEVDIDIEKIDS